MEEATKVALGEWESFYVIVGSSAAALTGLQFVVIALGADKNSTDPGAARAFASPIVVHFCAVLLLAGILTMPGHTPASFAWEMIACGIAGLIFMAAVFREAVRQTGYEPVREDWIWHLIIPVVAYAVLAGGGFIAFANVGRALYLVGAVALLLLFTGIRNSWDSAVWIATRHYRRGRKRD